MSQKKSSLNSGDDLKTQTKGCASSSDPVFSEYKKLVTAEKQSWLEYYKTLKDKYVELKRDVAKKKKIKKENFNFLDYLPEQEKDFYFQVKEAVEDYNVIQKGTSEINQSLHLMEHELHMKRNHLLEILNVAKEIRI